MSVPNLFGWHDLGTLNQLRRAKADRIDTQPVAHADVGPRGLLIRDPYASQILNGEKVWEIRGRPTQIRGPVVVIKSGTGRAYGTVNLARVLGPLDLSDLVEASELPATERDELRREGLTYAKTYAYVFTHPRWFERPIPYGHPSGAVTWVRLPKLDLETVRYAASPVGTTRALLV